MELTAMDDEQTNYASNFDMNDYPQQQEMNYGPSGIGALPPSSTAGTSNGAIENSHEHHDTQSHIDIDALQRMFDFVGDSNVSSLAPNGSSAPTSDLRSRTHGQTNSNDLIQHMQMQQFSLQQMQNQIIHQQMELMKLSQHLQNGQLPVNTMMHHFPHGLPTPVNSGNLAAQIQPDVQHSNLVSPMIPAVENMYDRPPGSASSSTNTSPNPFSHSMSAPARLAFLNNGVPPLPSPASIEYDLPPIPSPWLGPLGQGSSVAMPGASEHVVPSSDTTRKRPSHAMTGTDHPTRQSPAIRPTMGSGAKRGQRKASVSTNSTPMMNETASKRRKSLSGTPVVGSSCTPQQQPTIDTPSPVDITMPPPAVPGSGESKSSSSPTPTMGTKEMEPVTPSSIMGLMPHGQSHSHLAMTPITDGQRTTRAKSNGKAKASSVSGSSMSGAAPSASSSKPTTRRTGNSRSSFSNPALKTLLPDGVPPTSPIAGSHPPNSNSYNNGGGQQQSPVQPKKTSHKAAEQKRRDSLKTTFDDLRMLLPPIPLPSEDGYNHMDEPPLPGSLPPRGPPKGEPEGPNRHVSKLQLLRCGNDFIRQLKGRVDRRDEEIGKLRNALLRMREGVDGSVIEELDLERDLDAEEREAERVKRSMMMSVMDGEGEEDGDDE